LSEEAAAVARSLAHESGATVDVLHVCKPVEVALPAPEVGYLIRRLSPDETEARTKLAEFARRNLGDVRTTLVTKAANGSPAQQIARYARDSHADVIVLAARARGSVTRLVTPSLSGQVLRKAPCTVLLVEPSQRHPTPARGGRNGADAPEPRLAHGALCGTVSAR